jgi:hypothetical protein
MKLIELLKRWLRREPRQAAPNGSMDREMLAGMLAQIERTQDVELTCDEVLALMDQFAEMSLRGENAAEFLPLVQHHLEMCADCEEELDALLRILRASSNGNDVSSSNA